jgi:hypothetical protein
MNEWNIQSRSHACQTCEKPFADKAAYHTVLIDHRRQYLRMDVCKECWEGNYAEGVGDRKGFVSQWQGIYHAPPPRAPDPIQRETAEGLLRKLIEANDPSHGPACFILAVMLERKRLLKVKEQIQRDGERVFIYEQAGTGDLFTIADPNLQLNQLEAVQRDISQLLAHGLNPPPPQEAVPVAEVPEAAPAPLSI